MTRKSAMNVMNRI